MDAKENVELMLEIFRAIERRDAQRVFGLCHADVEFLWPPSLPYGGVAQGFGGDRPGWNETWVPLQPTQAEQRIEWSDQVAQDRRLAEDCRCPQPAHGGGSMMNEPRVSSGDKRQCLDLTLRHHAHIDRRLRTEPIIWLGTTRPDGRPHLVPVWFLWDGATVLIFSLPDTQKVHNLRHKPTALLALNAEDQGYDIVLLEGRASFVSDPSVRGTMPAFVEKYAGLPRRWAADAWAEKFSVPIRITPARLVGWMTRPGISAERTALKF